MSRTGKELVKWNSAENPVIVKSWKQPVCLSINERIRKILGLHTAGRYSDTEEDKPEPSVGESMHLGAVLSEINQAPKLKWCMVCLI